MCVNSCVSTNSSHSRFCSSSPSSAVTTSPSTNTITVTGIVPAAVNGVQQSDFKNFNVGQSGGAVSLTLTSALETLPGGMVITGVVMGLAIGSPSGTTCTLAAGTVPVLSGQISGTAQPGPYCVVVSDQTVQQGPVAYTVVINTP